MAQPFDEQVGRGRQVQHPQPQVAQAVGDIRSQPVAVVLFAGQHDERQRDQPQLRVDEEGDLVVLEQRPQPGVDGQGGEQGVAERPPGGRQAGVEQAEQEPQEGIAVERVRHPIERGQQRLRAGEPTFDKLAQGRRRPQPEGEQRQ